MSSLFRSGIGLALGAALLVAMAAPVAAAKPDRSFAEAGDILVSGFCDFDVVEHPLANNEYFTTFFDRDGNVTRTQVTGRLVLELINLETGRSIVVNASGPGRFVDDADGTTVHTGGTWILNFAGEFFMLSGRGVFRIDADGETIVARRGHIVELCPLLAD
jgi:hypothetical protein